MATPLFETERAKGRTSYNFFATSMLLGMCLIYFYRATHIPDSGERGRWAWMGMFCSEIWFGFYWIITQSARWNPIYRRTFKERLQQRYGNKLPGVDIFVCTADPAAEPPSLVISTVLSLLAYDYPPNKLNVYVSDDAGSELTFYALWEMSLFAKHWLPFCRRFKVEPRSPIAYFSKSYDSRDLRNSKDWASIKDMYDQMTNRINSVVTEGKVPEEFRRNKGFSEWNSTITSRNHQTIIQIFVDGRDEGSVDIDGSQLPTLVYVAREKRLQQHHNFKAGALNALLRVSSVISNNPIILTVDCDMYSNNSESIRDALCFFLDEDAGQEIAFVQYPQNFDNITRNDLYASALNVINNVELHGFDYWGGPPYIGTGCFHRREILCGRKYDRDYKEDWERTAKRRTGDNMSILEERAKALAACAYEQNTQWGKEIGLKYGCPAEDFLTGLMIHCRGWKSVYFNPERKGFLGVAPTTLTQLLVQHTRWGEGTLQIMTKYSPFIYGHGKMKLGLQMAYHVYGLWSTNSLASLYYLFIPSLCLLKDIALFPKVSNMWFIPFAYVILAKKTYSLVESWLCGDTINGWWNTQRMWVFKKITAYSYATIDTIFNLTGLSQIRFPITTKVADGESSKRYNQEVMEFGASSPMFTIIATYALLNLVCFVAGVKRLVVNEVIDNFDPLFLQLMLSGVVILINVPVYEALFVRKDNGSIPSSIMYSSIVFAMLACLLPVL